MTDNLRDIDNQLRLDLLREALPYIQRFKGQTFVVKLSGKVTEDHDQSDFTRRRVSAAASGRYSYLCGSRRRQTVN